MARIVSKAGTQEFRDNYDRIFSGRRKATGQAQRGGRWGQNTRRRVEEPHFLKLDKGVQAAARVLSLAETPRERDMFKSLLRTEGRMCNPDQIRAGEAEMVRRKHQ